MGICDIIGLLIWGLFAGLIARALMPGTQRMGLSATSLLGIGGAFVGGLIGNILRFGPLVGMSHFRLSDFIGTMLGSLLILFIAGAMRKR